MSATGTIREPKVRKTLKEQASVPNVRDPAQV